MVNVDEAQIAKLKSHGHTFEIMVDAALAMDLKHGKSVDMGDLLAIPKVFSDARKGEEASVVNVKQVFGTDKINDVVTTIIKKGEIPLTTDYKAKLREQKKRQIIAMIQKDAVDPKTLNPHPPQRIQLALEEAKFHVDESASVEHLMQEALKKIRTILPIKLVLKEMAVKIPGEFAAKSYPIIQKFGKKLREDWQSDGSYIAVVEIPGGLEEEFHNKLNALCQGNVETKIIDIK